jgi:hypothetical protein
MTNKSPTTEASSLGSSNPPVIALGRKAAKESASTLECAGDQTPLLRDPTSIARQELLMAGAQAPQATPCAKAHLRVSWAGVGDMQAEIMIQHP